MEEAGKAKIASKLTGKENFIQGYCGRRERPELSLALAKTKGGRVSKPWGD